MNEKSSRDFFGQHATRNILIVLCFIIVLLVVFQAGILVGYNKASFSNHLGDNYYRVFGDRDSMHSGPANMMNPDFPGGHGAAGKIVQVNLPTFIIAEADDVEKVVHIDENTLVRLFKDNASSSDIRVDDMAVVVGNPDDKGEIDAKLVRLVPPPVTQATSTIQQ